MPYREFQDDEGRAWEVWDVRPSDIESVTTSVVVGAGVVHVEGSSLRQTRLTLPVEFQGGWLAFKTNGESRRLAPIPYSWIALDDQDLALLVRSAKPSVRIVPRF